MKKIRLSGHIIMLLKTKFIQVQVYVLLIWFRIYLGKVYHLQVHRCFGSLKTEYSNSANQVHLWFEKQWFRYRALQRRTLTKSKTHESVANTCRPWHTVNLSQPERSNKYTSEVVNKAYLKQVLIINRCHFLALMNDKSNFVSVWYRKIDWFVQSQKNTWPQFYCLH